MSFLDRIADRIARHPDRVAARDVDRTLTFSELDARANVLARRLHDLSPSTEPVALDVDRSVELVVAILGVLRSGRGCLPIDREHPSARNNRILEGVSCLVTDAPAGEREDRLQIVSLRNDGPADPRRVRELLDLAYVLHTSGSTGEPKGVAMGREPLTHLVAWHLALEDNPAAPHTAQFARITFDVAWQEILTSLALGGTLSFVPDAVRGDPDRLLELLARERVTRLFLPTAYLQSVAERGHKLGGPRSLEHVFVAGSQLRLTPEIRAWFAKLDGCAFHNHYGPTETHVVTSHTLVGRVEAWPDLPPIGRPLPHVRTLVVDAEGRAVPDGERGELLVGGACLARGYFNRPDLTGERFVERNGERWYRTGDVVAWHEGALRYFGRRDRQVKVDGYRIEPGEIEVVLARHPDVADAHVGVTISAAGEPRLVAYVVARSEVDESDRDLPEPSVRRELAPTWRDHARRQLPAYAVPSIWLRIPRLPLNRNGKVDEGGLPAVPRERPSLAVRFAPPRTPTEDLLARLWERHLDLDGIGRDDNFFDLGGTSLLAAALAAELSRQLDANVPIVDLFANPTIAALAEVIDGARGDGGDRPPRLEMIDASSRTPARSGTRAESPEPIAIVGMACRFPGANDIHEFWDNLVAGRDSITRAPGAGDRVRAAGMLGDLEGFDDSLFGIPPAQARLLDPQHRVFLECCVEALEDAGCAWSSTHRSIGVFGGMGPSTYLLNNLLSTDGVRSLTSSVEDFGLLLTNDKDFLTGRVSYTLDLRGPSLNVNAACATSLFAVHHAIEALRTGSADIALAGAASIQVPQLYGYIYQDDMPFSPDGVCRVFERASAGTVFGNGVGVVALKRLSDAMADGDDIYAIVRGTGISNDGAQKVGMTAPSVAGQERAIRAALATSGGAASSIGYVEAHGTGTHVGDAIEIEALHRAYGPLPPASVGIGSVKTNVGHLGWAAGMAGLIKAIWVARTRRIPPTLHYREPNPELGLAARPFFVEDRLREVTCEGPLRVAVSAFGLGGFNAHVVLEEAPRAADLAHAKPHRTWHVLPFSARSAQARDQLIERHARMLARAPLPTADVARTLALGRIHHAERRAIVVSCDEDLREAIERSAGTEPVTPSAIGKPALGLFPGHGAEHRGMARALYDTEPVFRATLEQFDAQLRSAIGATVAELLYSEARGGASIHDVTEVHALVFAVQMATLQLWESKGIHLDVLLGHSLGHYAAACAAGVFSPRDGMHVVLERGRAIAATSPEGTMAVVKADERRVRALLDARGLALDVAVVNGPANTVVSGTRSDLESLAADSGGLEIEMLGSLRAGHSRLMAPAVARLVEAFRTIELRPPARTLVCNLSGDIADASVATPAYWGRHLCQTVRFADCLARARALGVGAFVELGGSPGLLGLAASVLEDHPGPFIAVLRPKEDAARSLAVAVATAYEAGLEPDWSAIVGEHGRLVHAASYPFQRRRHWIGPPAIWQGETTPAAVKRTTASLFHEVAWRSLHLESTPCPGRFAVVGSGSHRHRRVAAALAGDDPRGEVTVAGAGDSALRGVRDVYVVLDGDSDQGSDGEQASIDPVAALEPDIRRVLDVVHVIGDGTLPTPPRLWLVAAGAHEVRARDRVVPSQVALWSMGRVVALEHPELRTVLVDVLDASPAGLATLAACRRAKLDDRELAIRDDGVRVARLVRCAPAQGALSFEPERTYVITGGLTGLGLWTAEMLAKLGARHLCLVGRRPPGGDAQARIAQLRASGCTVEIEALDVTDEQAVDRLFADAKHRGRPIAGIVHGAGALDDCLIGQASWARFPAVLAAKVKGAWNLHHAAERHGAPLSFFMLFSSATALHGNYGQAAYAAANGFLDGLAQYRRKRGLPAVSIAWGVLDGVGKVSLAPALKAALERRGFGAIEPDAIREIFERHLAGAAPHTLVLPNDWRRFLDAHRLEDDPFYTDLADRDVTPDMAATVTATAKVPALTLRARLRLASAADRPALLAESIRRLLGRYVDVSELAADRPICELGLDSLSTIQVRNELQRALETSLPPRLLAAYPTVAAVVAHLLEDVVDLSAAASSPPAETPTTADASGSATLSIEQRRWLRLGREVRYGQRVVPVLFHDQLDRDAFLRALRHVVGRHEALRQRFVDGTVIELLPVDAVVPDSEMLFGDLQGVAVSARAEQIGGELSRMRDQLVDPFVRPSWTIRCLALSSDQFVVLLAGQHLELDGSGLSVFIDEIRRVYGALRAGLAPPPLPAVTQYREYAAAQAAYLAAEMTGDRAYFEGLFASLPNTTSLPRRPPEKTTAAYASRRYTPPDALGSWDACRAAAREVGVNPFALILGSYAALLAEVVDEPTVCISTIRSARTEGRFAATIGPFTMPFPVPIHVRGWSLPALVRQVDETLAALSARSRYPSTDLLRGVRAFAGLPLDTYFSDAGINFTHYRRGEQGGEPRVEIVEVLGEVEHPLLCEYDFGVLRRVPGLHLVAAVEDGALVANYWYHVHRFGVSRVASWAERHRCIFDAVVEACAGDTAKVASS